MARPAPSRYIPPDSQKIASKRSPVVVYLYSRGGRLCAVGYYGARSKSEFLGHKPHHWTAYA